ncbi:hypothetical protein XENOCAPTIV_008309, partial [Xenoophorus captivus]
WWFCQCESKRGWVPSSYLEPLDGPEEAEEPEPDYEGKSCCVIYCHQQHGGHECVCLLKEKHVSAGELHVTTQAYQAEQEDEISLEVGETVEVIHKLLDGWSTIRNAKSIHIKSRQKLSQDAYRKNSRRYLQQKGVLAPHRSSAKSPLRERKNEGNKNKLPYLQLVQYKRHHLISVLCFYSTDNIPEVSGSSSESELKKEAPVIPPRPSPELILERCTDNTCKKISINESHSGSSS